MLEQLFTLGLNVNDLISSPLPCFPLLQHWPFPNEKVVQGYAYILT